MSITFYEVDCDVDRYEYFLVDGDEAWRWGPLGDRHVVANGRSWADDWQPPPVFSFQPRHEEGDFWSFGLGAFGDVFAVRPEAFANGHLELLLGPAGELLPLPHGDRVFRVLNITECIDALDREATVWDRFRVNLDDPDFADLDEFTKEELVADPESVTVDIPRFRLDRLGWQLFKIPETAITKIYYWERSEDGEDEQLRAYCEREGLTGLVFRELYTTECPW